MGTSDSRKLKGKLNKALQRNRFRKALRLYDELQRLEPREARWPHRKGDLLKRLGRVDESLRAYEAAVVLYANLGFIGRAAAMAKVILNIDPERSQILDRLDGETARKLYRSTRQRLVTTPGAVFADDDAPTTPKRVLEEAVPLVVVKPVSSDELRFTRPPPQGGHSSMELELSELEVREERQGVDPTMSMRPSAMEVAQLPATPLFAEVPHEVLERIVRESRLVDLEDGEQLIEAGTTADALYALVEGRVQLKRPSQNEPIVLTEGDLVGISCLLDRVNYEASATAMGNVRALRISKLLLDRLVDEHPHLEELLLEILGRRLIANLVRSSSVFSVFDDRMRAKLANLFEVRRAEPETAILEAGKRSDGLYIPLLGELVARQSDGTVLGRVKLGSALGQETLLRKQASAVTVQAKTDVIVLRMPVDRFDELVSLHPSLIPHLEAQAERPSQPHLSVVPVSAKNPL